MYTLNNEEKLQVVKKQINLYEGQLGQFEKKYQDLIKMQAECNFISEVTGCKPSNFDNRLCCMKEDIEEIKKGLNCWKNYLNEMNKDEMNNKER